MNGYTMGHSVALENTRGFTDRQSGIIALNALLHENPKYYLSTGILAAFLYVWLRCIDWPFFYRRYNVVYTWQTPGSFELYAPAELIRTSK